MSPLIDFLKELGTTKLMAIGAAILALLITIALYMYKVSDSKMVQLYSDLELEDSAKIVQVLESMKIPYEVIADGAMIKVPENHVLQVRMSMAQEGLPNRGSIVGYEIFNHEESLGSTAFQQNIKMVRALEGELSRTISSFEQIDRARVHLVLPQREIFSKDKQDPKASVVLKLKNRHNLTKDQVDAISHLVATAVPGLEINNITIVDTKGKSMKLGSQDSESSWGAAGVDDYKTLYEQRTKHMIENLLEQSLGSGKVKVQISADMNFDRIVINSEIYDPDSAVARSVQSTEEKERNPIQAGENMDVSVSNNIPNSNGNPSESAANADAATIERTDETTNYEISKTIKNQISETGTIRSLSIAVLVDGSYSALPSGQIQYTPRNEEELRKIENLVKVAVGFREDRHDKIEVVNMPFYNQDDGMDRQENNWINEELPSILQTIVLGVIILLILITIIRPIAFRVLDNNKVNSGGQNNRDDIRDMTSRDSDMQNSNLSVTEAYTDIQRSNQISKAGDIVQSHPEETLAVLRRWLNESNN